MPQRSPHPCAAPQCPALTQDRYCPTHRRARQQQQDERRGSAASRGYDSCWQRYRTAYLAKHPLCATCAARDQVTAATDVDHIVPHRGDRRLFWDPTNHQALCGTCHDRKTAVEDGGFGRPVTHRATGG